MTRETKVGLLAGTALILLIGILVSDHLSMGPSHPADRLVNFATDVQRSVDDGSTPALTTGGTPTVEPATPAPTPVATHRVDPLPLPEELPAAGEVQPPAPVQQNPSTTSPPQSNPVIADAGSSTPLVVNPAPQHEASSWADVLSETPFLPARSLQSGRRTYHTVKANESLSEIAAQYLGSAGRWREIRDANPGKVTEQGWVREGVRLIIPQTEPQEQPATANGGSDTTTTTGPRTITVREGQTLSKIAELYLGSADRWQDIYEANRDTLRSPDRVSPGMVLRLPSDATTDDDAAAANRRVLLEQRGNTYTVRSGDTLSSIARSQLGDTERWYELYRANQARIADPDALQVGMVLTIPR